MKSYELLQKDLEAEQAKRRDAVKRAAKAEADLVVMSEACGQSAAHIQRVEAGAVRTQREADRLAAELQLMRDATDDLRAKLDASKAQHMDAQATVATLTDHLAQERRQHDATKRSAQTAIDAVTEAAEATASKSADNLRKMTDEAEKLRARVADLEAKLKVERESAKVAMTVTKAAHSDELKGIRAEADAAAASAREALGKLKEANKRLAAYGGAEVE